MTLYAVEVPEHAPVVVGSLPKVTLPWSTPVAVQYEPPDLVGGGAEILSVTLPQGGTSGGLDTAFKDAVTADLGTITARLDELEEHPPQIEPSGPAGGVLAGEYPNPDFHEEMASQEALTIGLGAKQDRHILQLVTGSTTANVGELIRAHAALGPITINPPSNAQSGDTVTVIKIDNSSNSVFWNGPVNSDANAELAGQWAGATFILIDDVWLVLSVNISYSAAPSATGGSGTGLTREQADARYDLLGAATEAASGVTKNTLGLSNVDNTADINKPVSNAVSAALANKADRSSSVAIAASGNVTLDAAMGNYQAISATTNVAFYPPLNPTDQQGLRVEVYAAGGTDKTVTTGGSISNGSGLALPFPLKAGRFAILGFVYSARAGRWMLVSYTAEP